LEAPPGFEPGVEVLQKHPGSFLPITDSPAVAKPHPHDSDDAA